MQQWKMYILSCIWGPLLVAQIVLVFIFGIFNEAGLDILIYAGWVIWAISVVFGLFPIFVFKRKESKIRLSIIFGKL